MATIQVSIVVPVYNEVDNLPQLAHEIHDAMQGSGFAWEVLFVDDASTDGSLDVLRRIAERDSAARVIRHRKNAGQSAAMATGFRRARGDYVVPIDADLQNDPADIPRLLEYAGEFELVSGVRANRRDTWARRIASRVANRVRNRIIGDSVADAGCTLKVYRTRQVRELPVFNGLHRFLPALVKQAGARIKELPVNHRPRVHGTAKYTIGGRLWRGWYDLIGVRWLQSRFIPPDNDVEDEPASTVRHGDTGSVNGRSGEARVG